MRIRSGKARLVLMALSVLIIISAYSVAGAVTCRAETAKADLSAISGFTNGYTIDKDGKFEISGVMVSDGSLYNITVDGDKIQSWCGKLKGRTWSGETLTELLDKPSTVFYEKVTGNKDEAEYTNQVKFTRPNGKEQ